AVSGRGLEQRCGRLSPEQIRKRGRVDDTPDDRIVSIGWRDEVLARADSGQQGLRDGGVVDIAGGTEVFEDFKRLVQMPLRDRTGAGFRDEPAEREMTESGLVPLAEQIEQRRALGVVVVSVGAAVRLRVERAAQPQILPPGGRGDGGVE